MTLNTVSVSIDPSGYIGSYRLSGLPQIYGASNLVVVRGLQHALRSATNQVFLDFTVTANNEISVTFGQSSVSTSGTSVTFITTKVEIDPGRYVGKYQFISLPLVTGRQTYQVIVDAQNRLTNAAGLNNRIANFNVSSDGTITTDFIYPGVELSNHKISFKTFTVTIDPGEFDGNYRLPSFDSYTGPVTLELIQGLEFKLRAPELVPFSVTECGATTSVETSSEIESRT